MPNDRLRQLIESPDPLSRADLEVVVELQKAELDRLLRDNARLQDRVAQLIALQEREQVLRQQLQSILASSGVGGAPAAEDRRALTARARQAEKRYGRLKSALVRLVDAMERGKD